MTYCLDSSFLIDLVHERRTAVDLLHELDGRLVITALNAYELERYDASASTLTRNKQILGFTDDAVGTAAGIYRRLEQAGTLIADIDIFIAAICIAHDCTLVTRDKDFEHVPELDTRMYTI